MSLRNYGVLDRQTTNTERWISFAALFLFGFTTACNLFKASPVLTYIAADLNMSNVGMIMTCYSIAALVCAIPGAWIMRKVGVKTMVVFSCSCMVVGTAISAIAPSAGLFLVGRTIEGIAYGLICVCGPNILPRLFPRKQMGLAVGIWSQWIPCGTIIAFFCAPLVFNATGAWRGVWYVSLGLGILALILLIVLVKMPHVCENEIVAGNAEVKAAPGKQFMVGGVAVCAIFVIWVYIYVVNINQMYPTFLQEVKGMTVFNSSMLPNWLAIITIPLGILAGVLSDRVALRKWILVIAYAVVAIIFYFFAFTPGTETTSPWIFCIVMGICASFIPTYTRGITPLLVTDPAKTDIALTVMAFMTGVAQCMAAVCSIAISELGWFANSQYILAPLALLACILTLIFVTDDRKVAKIRAEEEKAQLDAAGIAEEPTASASA